MSGKGAPSAEALSLDTDGTGLKVTIVSGLWHTRISEGLLAGARGVLEASGAEVSVVQVPGSFELPVASKVALDAGADAVVALGVIVRGETPHFDYVAAAATDGLTRVCLDTGKPVGFGVLTLDTEQQGLDRAGLPESKEDIGARAAEAALAMANVLRGLRG
ncbi:MAG TPA: 6,7-dimethyl-8-ribityllumazine synthase [Pseudolysinimonas sp.]|nr:6,7-dimethyl-8-ribityllumazine synthase [Pseudolysinimonas sp.]